MKVYLEENGQISDKNHDISDIVDQNGLISDISVISDKFPLLATLHFIVALTFIRNTLAFDL